MLVKREEDAKKVLQRVRNSPEEIEKEIHDIKSITNTSSKILTLLSNKNL